MEFLYRDYLKIFRFNLNNNLNNILFFINFILIYKIFSFNLDLNYFFLILS